MRQSSPPKRRLVMERATRRPGWRAVLALAVAVTVQTAFAEDGARSSDAPDRQSQQDDLVGSHKDIERNKPTAAPGQEWWRDVVARFPNCRAASDDCQTCAKDGAALTCSTPAIACVRGEWHCTREGEPAAVEPAPAEKNENKITPAAKARPGPPFRSGGTDGPRSARQRSPLACGFRRQASVKSPKHAP